MPISPDFSPIFEENHKINFLHCTPNGILKYTDLCNLFQLTASSHAELGGFSHADMQIFNQAWVLSRMKVEIIDLPKWQDEVTVKTWIKSLEGYQSVRCLEMYLNGKKIIGCETFWVVINTNTRRPENLAIPYDHFTFFPNNHATSISTHRINIPENPVKLSEKTIKLSDIDIVNHANNVKYLEWSLDEIEPEIILEQKIKSFSINFLQEVNLQDKIQINHQEDKESIKFSITKNNKTCYALELHLTA
ncbi:acyl-[acyl-carrier-protein] thioesterase [Flavobacterium oreochromis]|uniref:Acyl-ACP thioesterase domain-containing protein n=1 Tax=Flavobacterium oreochromis TaxID=2906078 RepID=A0ABW8P732_9FLAO|nr:acyl-ACP thioesterase domain-containing protein [Flavobacterium oreochromis]OWP76104.1 acyl-[acyl-carrier-protein] thioesterase [Flavobacterium oreochromis]POR23240.1 acyl-[acyl-carrier-protein] thioesterase [Flavobacterium columnare]